MNNKYKIAVLYGTLHGFNDFIAGFLLSSLSVSAVSTSSNIFSYLLYSIIAFGGQLPAGIIVDKTKKIKLFSLFSVVFMIASVFVFYVNIYYAIIFSAVASAFIHVCGGAACYVSDTKSSTLTGIFTSPGVVGLIAGGIVATTSFSYFFVLVIVLSVLFLILLKIQISSYEKLKTNENNSLLETHDFFMLALLLAIAFRSLLWNVMHMICFNNTTWLFAIAFSAFTGKLIGGYISDKIDWKNFVFFSMFSSVIFLNLGKEYLPVFCIGIALLQSAVPVTLLLMQQYLKASPATGAGLALGLSIIIAGIPAYFEHFVLLIDSKKFLLLLSIVILITNFWLIRKEKPLS